MPIVPINMARGATQKESQSLRVGAVVEYENSGKILLGIITNSKKNKWTVSNDRGGEVEMSSDRLYLLKMHDPAMPADNVGKQRYLSNLIARATQLRSDVDLNSLWEIAGESKREMDSRDLTELAFSTPELAHYVAVRHELLENKIYFKRTRMGFEPRETRVVEELKVQQRQEEEREAKRREKVDALLSAISRRVQGHSPSPMTINLFEVEQLAAQGMAYPGAKDALKLVEEVIESGKLNINGRPEDKAFRLLVESGHFSEHENLAMHRFRRPTAFAKTLLDEATALLERLSDKDRSDLRHIEIISIDAASTRDIDDAISLEETPAGHRLGVHITDVSCVIPHASQLFQEALTRATTIYCPDFRIPMLPELLSEQALSLIAGEDRYCVSFFVTIGSDGAIVDREICRSVVRVSERMTYEEVDEILFADDTSHPHSINSSRSSMLTHFWSLAVQLEERRTQMGAYQVTRREMVPVVLEGGRVVLEQYSEDSPSRKLVGELMVLANETAAEYAARHNIALVFRSQEAPDQEIEQSALDIPEGPARDFARRGIMKRSTTSVAPALHSGLGLKAYAQATSPIRRVVDLINQSQLTNHLSQAGTLSSEAVANLLAQASQALDEANAIQRESTRYWLLRYLKQEGIKELSGVIVKVDGPKPLVEIPEISLISPFHAQAQHAGGNNRARLGKQIRLKIDSLDPRKDVLVLSEIV